VSIGFASFAGMADTLKHMQQFSDRSDGKRNGAQIMGVEFKIGGSHGNVPFHGGSNPDHTAATEI
jgi:hypothetical protein